MTLAKPKKHVETELIEQQGQDVLGPDPFEALTLRNVAADQILWVEEPC